MLLLPLCELCHFLTSDFMKVYSQWVPCERNFSYNFIPIFSKLCICFLHGLEMCMWSGYNPWINFCHFFHFVNFIFSDLRLYEIYRQCVPCKPSSLYIFILIYMQLCTSFIHGLKMCMWFGFNLAVNFCHISTLLTSSFFKFSQVRHQLHRSSIYIFIFILFLIEISVCKQCRPWSDAAVCSIWSGSALFA